MALLNAIIAVLAIFGMLALVVGYRGSLREPFTATWYFIASLVLMTFSVTGRLVYWDLLWATLRNYYPAHAEVWREVLSRAEMNFAFNCVFLVGLYFGLKARQLLIPPDELPEWPWWRAWAHPQFFWIMRKDRRQDDEL